LITCPTPTRTEYRYGLTAIPVEQATADHPQKPAATISTPKAAKVMVEKQETVWKQQSMKNWFLLFVILFIISGCLLGAHKLLDRSAS